MNPAYRSLADDLVAIAEARGLPCMVALGRSVLDENPAPSVAILELSGDAPIAVEEWALLLVPGATIDRTRPGPDLDVTLLRSADVLVACFACDAMPDSDVLDGLRRGVHARPPLSSLFLFTDAERIESPRDLEQVESSARRWFLPPVADGAGPASLIEHAAGLWSTSDIAEPWLADRVKADVQALGEILQRQATSPPSEPAIVARLAHAIDLIEAEAPPAHAPSSPPNPFEADDRLARLRKCLLDRSRSDVEVVEDEARVAIETLEGDLASHLALAIEQSAHQPNAFAHALQAGYGAALDSADRRLAVAFGRWSIALDSLSAEAGELAWSALAPGVEHGEPEGLRALLDSARLPPPALGTGPRFPGAPEVRESPWYLKAIGTGAIVGPVSAGLAGLIGLGPPGMMLAGGAAAAATVGVGFKSSLDARRSEASLRGEEVAALLVTGARKAVDDWLDGQVRSLRSRLSAHFQAIVGRLAAVGRDDGDRNRPPELNPHALRDRLAAIPRSDA